MGFKLINKDIAFPNPYPTVERKEYKVNQKGVDIVGGYSLRDEESFGKYADYMPQPGMQEALCACESNLIFICGQATSGKTYAMFLKALQGIERVGNRVRLISVRLQDSKKGGSIFGDGVKVCGNFANCEYNSSDYPTFSWPQWNSNIQLIHSNFNYANPVEKKAFEDYAKKNQASLIMIDEATEINHFGMFTYWFSRNRDSSGIVPQMILSFNPLHGHWTTEMLKDSGYLGDDWYLRPEMMGVTRYFYNKGKTPSEIVWGDTPQEVAISAGLALKPEDEAAGLSVTSYVKSFTVFTATAADNRKLAYATKGQSIANLHATGAEQRAIVGEAYFGPVDNEEINVNRSMIHQLWQNPVNDDENMYATLDVSGGSLESDNAPMLIWRGSQLIDIKFFRGNPKELVDWIDKILKQYNIPIDHFAYDATGIGYYLRAYTAGRPITANKRCLQEYDEHGNQVQLDEYFNLRSQLLGKTEVMLKKGELSFGVSKDLTIPYGKNNATRRLFDVLCDEMNVFITTTRNKKIYFRSKDEYKSKFKSSPDLMDAISYRAIFELDTRQRKQPKPQVEDNAYNALYQQPPIGWGSRRFIIPNP